MTDNRSTTHLGIQVLCAFLIPPAVGGLTALLYFLPHLRRWRAEESLAPRCVSTRSVVLSYDDGPGRELTPRLLDLLATSNAKATFLLLGRRVNGSEALISRMAAEGHEIGCHGQDHLNAWKSWPWRSVNDIRRGYETLSQWVRGDALFRPPYGKLSLPAWWEIRRRGARLAWWTIDSGDTHAALPRPMDIADQVARAGGGVVLMHDFDRDPERVGFVLETTELLLSTAAREGLNICRYSDLFEARRLVAAAE